MAIEQPVGLQTDTVGPAPGAPVRTIVATVMINGVPTPVAMQVVAVADPDGILNSNLSQTPQWAADIIAQLCSIRRILGLMAGVPILDDSDDPSPIKY